MVALIIIGLTMMACQTENKSLNNNSTTASNQNNAAVNDKENVNSANDSKEESSNTKTEKSAESNNSRTDRKSVSGAEVTGTFRYEHTGEFKGSFNEIKILALGNNKLKVGFDLTYPNRYGDKKDEVSANVGQAVGEAEINGDTAVYSTTEGGTCEIKIKFVKSGQITVTQTEKQLDGGCGFGLNVSAQGTYKRVSSSKPTFDAEN